MNESPLIEFRFIVEADLRQQASPEERRRLHENPVLWLKVLTRLQLDVEGHIGKDHLRLATMKPMPGEQPSHEYIMEKKACSTRTSRRMHFLGIVKKRMNEVAAICGDQPVPLVGDVVTILVKIIMLIEDGKTDNARCLAQTFVEKWSMT